LANMHSHDATNSHHLQTGGMATMGRALSAGKIWGRSYVWYRLWFDLAQIRGLFVGVDRGRCVHMNVESLHRNHAKAPPLQSNLTDISC
jgi:hypothetical protein